MTFFVSLAIVPGMKRKRRLSRLEIATRIEHAVQRHQIGEIFRVGCSAERQDVYTEFQRRWPDTRFTVQRQEKAGEWAVVIY